MTKYIVGKEIEIENQESSPFKVYEERYCNRCGDYRGCLGLIDSMSMSVEGSSIKSGNAAFDNMMKSVEGMTYTNRFKIILECMQMRSYLETKPMVI